MAVKTKSVTRAAPDTLAIVYSPAADSYVYVYQDGRLRLERQDQVLDLDLRESPLDWWQFTYLRALVEQGVSDEELLAAIRAVRQASREMSTETLEESLEADFALADAHARAWFKERGLNYDTLSEDEIADLAVKIVHEWRASRR